MKRFGTVMKKAGKAALLKDSKRGKHFSNINTGKELRGLPIYAAAGLGAVGMFGSAGDSGLGSGTGLLDMTYRLKPKLGEIASGQPAIMMADGGGGHAPTLGATGDMVFGMHNRRKG